MGIYHLTDLSRRHTSSPGGCVVRNNTSTDRFTIQTRRGRYCAMRESLPAPPGRMMATSSVWPSRSLRGNWLAKIHNHRQP